MRLRFAWIIGLYLVSVGQAVAQTEAATKPSQAEAPEEKKDAGAPATEKPPVDLAPTVECAFGYPFWFQAEYLLWGVKNAPLPVPLVTTGDPKVGFEPNLANTVNTAGAIGQPGTHVLLGGNTINFPLLSGVRVTVGGWISEDQRLGIEGGGFLFERATSRFAAASDGAGSPPLYFPIFSGIAGAERGIPIADPLRSFSGDVAVRSNLQLRGAEANFLGAFYRSPDWDFTLLVGFRYADLCEGLQIHNTTKDLLFGNTMILNDSFQTSNQFYGGQIGGRLNGQIGSLFVSVASKVALGSVHQIVNIQGDITQAGPNPLVPPGLGTFPGGLFAQSSNIGRRNANALSVPFSVLPTLELKLGWQFTDRLRAFAGYDVLYWTQVLRPGKQIDHNVNLSQNAVLDPSGTGNLVGPAQPALVLSRSDFWAQGVSFGLEVRY
jgi:hypothetical protein